MLFNEFYGTYYRAVAEILRKALEGPVKRAEMVRICQQHSFGDAWLNIPKALTSGAWPLMTGEGCSILESEPSAPLTLLEKRWLKAISLDPRVQLFGLDLSFAEDVEPLFYPEDFICFDCYSDGDDYADPAYRAHFRTLMQAISEGRSVRMTYASRRRRTVTDVVTPVRLEYSEKDDRFRVLCAEGSNVKVRNLSGVVECTLGDVFEGELPDPDKRESRRVVLEVRDTRNALERVSLHFTHLRKEVERAGERTFKMTLWYDASDEPEMIIRVLQYGPALKVLEPAGFRSEVKKRLEMQLELLRHRLEPDGDSQ
ncbi:MAG: WYL domain-containing protein [Clostridia bacterium]|nr:WYL domain-containing protein [Clostridia bacterium]